MPYHYYGPNPACFTHTSVATDVSKKKSETSCGINFFFCGGAGRDFFMFETLIEAPRTIDFPPKVDIF